MSVSSWEYYIQEIQEEAIEAESPQQTKRARQTIRIKPEDFETIAALPPEELRDVNLVVYHKWDNTRRFLERLNPRRQSLITHGHAMKSWNPWRRNSRFHLENFRGALDAAGEWFLARDGTLYYKPRPGEAMLSAKVVCFPYRGTENTETGGKRALCSSCLCVFNSRSGG